eukprot:scaffold89931_cov35-Prasinocladus_malaysianus.AAC.1
MSSAFDSHAMLRYMDSCRHWTDTPFTCAIASPYMPVILPLFRSQDESDNNDTDRLQRQTH